MSAKTQLEKEIREAIIFLREHNNTIPSETIEYMKQASLSQLKQDTEDPLKTLNAGEYYDWKNDPLELKKD